MENSKENEEGVHDQSHYIAEGGKCEGHLRSLFLRMNEKRKRNKFIRKTFIDFPLFQNLCESAACLHYDAADQVNFEIHFMPWYHN